MTITVTTMALTGPARDMLPTTVAHGMATLYFGGFLFGYIQTWFENHLAKKAAQAELAEAA